MNVKASEIIREVMSLKDVKVTSLASRLNIKQSTLSQRFRQTNISVDKMNEMLLVMDYKVVVVPRESRVPDGGFELE